jgi:diguanylate cyclase (GGDEF)-like protein
MRFSPGSASHLAAVALVVVLLGIGGFVVRSMMAARDAATDAHRSAQISIAYDDARYRLVQVQRTAEAHLKAPSPETRAEFDLALRASLASVDTLRELGDAEDVALVNELYANHLPALEAVQRIFLAIERGEPITDEIPPPDTATRILALLEPRAGEHQAESASQLQGLVDGQGRDLRITAAVCAVGLLLVLALIMAAQAFGRREALHRAELTRLRTAALTDSLTGLGNHRAFVEEVRRQVARSMRHNEQLALAVIDVDEFKEINDTWGHARGDAVLQEVAGLLSRHSRQEDYAFRIGGDEFAMILPHADGATAFNAMERLREATARALPDGPTISLGLATLRHAEGDEGVLRQQADSALYEAKLKGRNAAVLFVPTEGARPVFPAAKLAALRQLVADGGVNAVFQPIWNLNDGTLFAHEALARIPDEYDIPGPRLAFDIAERIGKSAELDSLCREAILRGAAGIPDGSLLFVNVSPYSLTHAGFSAEALSKEFIAAGLPPSRVVLEITERSTVSVAIIEGAVEQLREAGFRIALDDVGAGNAGLEMLRRVRVDYVKIDNEVLISALRDTMARAAVMAIAAFASQAGTLVVAEGVEDEAMMELVRWIASGGDDEAPSMIFGVQGYLLGYPEAEIGSGTPPSQLAA